MTARPRDAGELATALGATLSGPDRPVRRLAAPGDASADSVVVAFDRDQLSAAHRSGAGVVVVPAGLAGAAEGTLIQVTDARLAMACLSALFDERPLPAPGVHPGAVVGTGARLGREVRVGAGAVVGEGARIGDRSVVGEGAVVGAFATVGRDCRLHPRATLADGVTLGDRVVIQCGAVIGSDGFGYAASAQGAVKIHHLGSVVIGNDVEIGANTCVDRGTLGDTVIGERSKIDNLCQIAHNVVVGRDCLIAGHSAVAGSARIGDRVTMAGGVGVRDHVLVGDGAVLGARAAVLKDVPAGETWLGYPAQPYRSFARQSYLLGRLERIWSFVRERERRGEAP